MWAVRNETDYAAERAFVRDRDGAEIWIVAVRATFVIREDGKVVPADEQQPVVRAPEFTGEPTASSLRYESDLVRTKLNTDIVLHATAYAPAGRQSNKVEVSFKVGDVAKTLIVHGPRKWELTSQGVVAGESPVFETRRISYENALGGPLEAGEIPPRDRANPCGVGLMKVAGAPAATIELPGRGAASNASPGYPAGFGPVACHWTARAKLAGTYDAAWQKKRQPLVPEDFDDAYFQCAPPDQQARGFLTGGEQVILHNLTPDGDLRFVLPRLSLGFRTRIDGGTTHHRGTLHTVIIEPDERRLIMVWHTALPCHHTLYTLKETVVFEKERLFRKEDAQKEVALA